MTFAFKCSNEAISDFFHLFILEKKLKREQGFNIAAMLNGTLDIFFKKGGEGRFQLQQIQTFKILFYDLNKTAFHILQINILVLHPPPKKKEHVNPPCLLHHGGDGGLAFSSPPFFPPEYTDKKTRRWLHYCSYF